MEKNRLLYAVAFVMDATFALVGLCVPLLAIRLGATYDDLGAIGAAGALVYTVSCVLSGRLSDRVGYRRTMVVASFAAIFVFLLYTSASSVVHIFLLVAASRLSLAGFWPPTQAWLGQGRQGRDLLQTLGKFNVCWSLGIFAGPAVGGWLFNLDQSWPFLAASAGASTVFLALLVSRHSVASSPSPGPHPSKSHPDSRRYLQVAWVANFSTFFAGGAVRYLFPKLATDLGISSTPLGWLMATVGLAQLVAFYLVSRSSLWQFRLMPLVVIQILGVLGLCALAGGSSLALFAFGLATQGAVTGVTFTSSIFYSFHAGGGGRRTGVHEAVLGSGHLFGPLLGGFAGEHLSPRAPYALSAGVIVAAVLIQLWLVRRPDSVRPSRADG